MNPILRAIRFLRVPLVVTALGVVGVVVRPADDATLATPAEKAEARAKIRCRGDLCFGLLSPPVGQCASLAACDGCDPDMAQGCPGDAGYVAPAAAHRLRRLLHCAAREGALSTWHADPVLPGDPCGVSLMFTRAQARAWIERLDADASTALVDIHRANAPAHLKRGSGLAHTWAGMSPDEDEDDAATLDDEVVPPEDAGP